MYVFAITLFLVLVLCAGIAGVVVIGMKGMFSEEAPATADFLAKTAKHLNGDAPAPERLERLLSGAAAE